MSVLKLRTSKEEVTPYRPFISTSVSQHSLFYDCPSPVDPRSYLASCFRPGHILACTALSLL